MTTGNIAEPALVPALAAAAKTHSVTLQQTGEVYDCIEGETILKGMARLGKKGIPAGCLNGGCGVCKVSITSGKVHKTGPMSRAHVSAEEEAKGVYLACRVALIENVEIEVLGKMKKAVIYRAWGSAQK
jgi:ferredoxin